MNGTTPKGFVEKLFDFSFTQFITASIIKVLYIMGIILNGILALAMLISGIASGSVGAAILGFVLAPIVFALSVIWLRVCLELVIVIFRIGENTTLMAKGPCPDPGPGAPPAPGS